MIRIGSHLVRADNSGVKLMKCIRIPGGSFQKVAGLGQLIRVSIKRLDRSKKKVQKKKIYNALIVGLKYKTRRKDGTFVKFDKNRALILSEQNKFMGTRVYGPLCKEIRGGIKEVKYRKIIAYSKGTA